MPQDNYRLTDVAPCQAGEVIRIGDFKFRVISIEPLYYEFRNIVGGIDVGFNTAVYPIPNLTPAKDDVYYITGFSIYGRFEAQLKFQSGQPRNTVGAVTSQRLNRFQAPLTQPFTFKFAIISGDKIEADIVPAFAGVRGALWFYGWKLKTAMLIDIQGEAKNVEDVRENKGLVNTQTTTTTQTSTQSTSGLPWRM